MKEILTFQYTEKRSRFFVYIYEIHSSVEFKSALREIQNQNKKAKHILRVGRFENHYGIYITEASEDKEPISSMKKVASFLEKDGIQDRGIFIVRYFGGVKFGANYLDKVYTDLAMKAVKMEGESLSKTSEKHYNGGVNHKG